MNNDLNILWLGITYPPAIGGAASYAELMANTIDSERLANKAIFLVGRHPNEQEIICFPNKISEVLRYLTYRAARPSKGLISYFLYFLDNIKLLGLKKIAKRNTIDVIIVHGWYMLRPSFLGIMLPILKKSGFKLVADIRDCYLSENHLSRLDVFDKIICCGKNVEELVCRRSQLSTKAVYVPVPLGNMFETRTCETGILTEHDLKSGEYIFSPNGVSNDKRFPLLYDAWLELLSRGFHLDLVVAGRARDWEKKYDAQNKNGRLIFVDNASLKFMSSLYSNCAIAVNVSNNESFGRVPSEALQLKIPMIFPSGVPEFSKIPAHFITKDGAISVADQISYVISSKAKIDNYDLSIHDPLTVCRQTIDAINDLFCEK